MGTVEGFKVLFTETENILSPIQMGIILAVAISAIIIFIVGLGFLADGELIQAAICAAVCVSAVIGLVILTNDRHFSNRVKYKGYFTEAVNIAEFTKKYEIVEQEGDLFTICLKEEKEN